jgi:hypothetical protein
MNRLDYKYDTFSKALFSRKQMKKWKNKMFGKDLKYRSLS